jgi:hypothetical protein
MLSTKCKRGPWIPQNIMRKHPVHCHRKLYNIRWIVVQKDSAILIVQASNKTWETTHRSHAHLTPPHNVVLWIVWRTYIIIIRISTESPEVVNWLLSEHSQFLQTNFRTAPCYSWRSLLLTSGRAASLFHIIRRGKVLKGTSSTTERLHPDSYLPTTKSMQMNSPYIQQICSDCQDLPCYLCYTRFVIVLESAIMTTVTLLLFKCWTNALYKKRRIQIDAILVINVFWGSKSCPSFMDIIDLRVPIWKLQRHLHLFRVSPHIRNCNKFSL